MAVPLRIYLAGPANELEYRKEIQENYGTVYDYGYVYEFIDPIQLTPPFVGITLEDVLNGRVVLDLSQKISIVENDKILILSCKAVIAHVEKFTCGTCMEIFFAYENKIPVYLISSISSIRSDVWIGVHTHKITNSIDDCMVEIMKDFNIDVNFDIDGSE